MYTELVNNGEIKLIHLNCRHLDASNADELFEQVKETLVTSKRVVMDLSGLELIDSSGLGFLLNCYKFLKKREAEMRVVARNKLVLSLFELVYFNNIVEVFDSISNAVNLPQAV